MWDLDFEALESGTVMTKEIWESLSDGYVCAEALHSENATVVTKNDGLMLKLDSPSSSEYLSLVVGDKTYDPLKTANVKVSMDLILESITSGDQHLVEWVRLSDAEGATSAIDLLSMTSDGKLAFCGKALDVTLTAGETYSIEIDINGVMQSASLTVNGTKLVSSIPCSVSGTSFDGLEDNGIDMIRFFRGSSSETSAVYYADNIKIKNTSSDPIIATDFTGWDNYGSSVAEISSDGRMTGGSLVTENGNSYVKLSSGYMFVYDKYMSFGGNDFELDVDVYLASTSSASSSSFISFLPETSSGTTYFTVLSADGAGNLYADGNTVGSLTVGDWTNIRVVFNSNGTGWDSCVIYVNGEFAAMTSFWSINWSSVSTASIRFKSISSTELRFDDLRIKYPEKIVSGISLDFETQKNINEALAILGGKWKYGTIGSTRTNSLGETVTTAEILGADGEKYLRYNHEHMQYSAATYIDMPYENFVDKDCYRIDTAVRYDSSTAYSLTVAEIFDPETAKSSALLTVRGDNNRLFVIIRGVQYELVDANGDPIYVPTTSDDEFAKISVLVNTVNGTYTVYVNDALAYYSYANENKPCTDLPIHYSAYTVSVSETSRFVRILNIPMTRFCNAKVDIDYLNVASYEEQ